MNRTIVYSLFFFFFSCAGKGETIKTEPEAEISTNLVTLTHEQVQQANIATGKPQRQVIQTEIKVNGVVEAPPQHKVTISFPFGGYVLQANLLPGMQVRKGQVLALLQDPSFVQLQQDFLTTRSRLQYLEREYNRQQTLNKSQTTSDKVFEQTAADYRTERISVQALKEKLLLLGINPAKLHEGNISRTVTLYAPISGYVSAVNVNRGKYVSPTDVLFELVNPADLHLSITVFEKDLPAIRPGQKAKAWLTADTSKPLLAEVHYVGKNLDNSRSALVHCDFVGSASGLVPGMFLNASIITSEKEATVVPQEAVVRFGAGEYIFIGRGNNAFEMVPVQTGSRTGDMVALLSENATLLQQTIITQNAYAALMKLHNRSEEE